MTYCPACQGECQAYTGRLSEMESAHVAEVMDILAGRVDLDKDDYSKIMVATTEFLGQGAEPRNWPELQEAAGHALTVLLRGYRDGVVDAQTLMIFSYSWLNQANWLSWNYAQHTGGFVPPTGVARALATMPELEDEAEAAVWAKVVNASTHPNGLGGTYFHTLLEGAASNGIPEAVVEWYLVQARQSRVIEQARRGPGVEKDYVETMISKVRTLPRRSRKLAGMRATGWAGSFDDLLNACQDVLAPHVRTSGAKPGRAI